MHRYLCASLLLSFLFVGAAAFGAELKFIPMVEIRDIYNNNIFFDYNKQARQSDFFSIISPGVKITDRTERMDASIQSRLNIIRYRENTGLNANDQDHQSRLRYRISERWRMMAEAGYIRDSQIDRDIEVSGLLLGTTRRDYQRYTLQTDYALTEKTATHVSYAYDKQAFDETSLVDSQTHKASLGVSHNLGALSDMTLVRAAIDQNTYIFPDTKIKSVTGTVGISRHLFENLSLTLDVGRHFTRPVYEQAALASPADSPQRTRGAIGQFALIYTGDAARVSLGGYHDVRAVSGISGTTARSSLRLDGMLRLSGKLSGGLSLEYYLNKADRGKLASQDIDKVTWRVQPQLRYDFNNDLTIEISYRYTRVEDTLEKLVYEQHMGFLRLTWQYPLPH